MEIELVIIDQGLLAFNGFESKYLSNDIANFYSNHIANIMHGNYPPCRCPATTLHPAVPHYYCVQTRNTHN